MADYNAQNSADQDLNKDDLAQDISDLNDGVDQNLESSNAFEDASESELENNSETNDSAAEIATLNNKVMQLMADFDNYRRRTESEKVKYVAMGNMSLLMQIADVRDDISLAQSDANLDLEAAKQMLSTVKDKITQTMAIGGLAVLEVNKGDKFDSQTMEAITTIAKTEDAEANTVADVVASGYKHVQTNEIVKTAKVVVFK